MSISSAKLIQRRTLQFCRTINNWQPNSAKKMKMWG